MTSRVMQAMPQLPATQTGVDGKTARKGAPQGDFADALGLGKTSKVASGTSTATELDVRPARSVLPRLTPKFDSAIDTSQEPIQELDVVLPRPVDAAGDATGDTTADTPTDVRSDERVDANDGGAIVTASLPAAPPGASSRTETPTPAPTAAAEVKSAGAWTPPVAVPQATKTPARIDRDILLDDQVPSPRPSDSADEKLRTSSFMPMGRSGQAEPIVFEPAARPSATVERSADGQVQPKETPSQASPDPMKTAPRVTVVGQQNIPAPAPATALALVESIAAGDLLEPVASRLVPDAIQASVTHTSAQSLKIQLRPAELGMVTATLRFSGEQLSIELQVENHEAYRRLSTDSDTIVGTLRNLGYDIDRVTVLHPLVAPSAAARTDPQASMSSPQGRGAEQFGSGMANGGSGGSGGRSPEQGGNPGHGGPRSPLSRTETAGRDLYI
jgi:flagellar hook-length control protein FliK